MLLCFTSDTWIGGGRSHLALHKWAKALQLDVAMGRPSTPFTQCLSQKSVCSMYQNEVNCLVRHIVTYVNQVEYNNMYKGVTLCDFLQLSNQSNQIKSINQSTNQSINQSINPIHQSINQSIEPTPLEPNML